MFNKKRQKNLIYFAILVLAFFIFYSRSSVFNGFKLQVASSISFPSQVISNVFLEVKKFIFYRRTFDEYLRLRKEVGVLRSKIVGMEEVIAENKRLEELLDFKRRLIFSSVVARVVARNPSSWDSTIIIDKGRRDGIKEGAAVVNGSGVIGKVAELGTAVSKVILITDPQFNVSALIQRSRESVLLSGTLEGYCRLRFLEENANIKVHDQVITSKLSFSFPEGLLLGEVSRIDIGPSDQVREYVVRPSASLSQLEEVLVILK